MNMNIGIDISQIVYEGTGVARFTEGLVRAILKYDQTNKWTFFFSGLRRNLDRELENKILAKGNKLIKWKIPPTLLSYLWNNLHDSYLSSIFYPPSSNSLDWFITSDWTEPPLRCKKAAIVHDLVYLRYPKTVDAKILITQRKRLRWVKKESSLIFSDSESTKQDLIDLVGIEAVRIKVNYPGITTFQPTHEQIVNTLKKYYLTKPFILTVGKLEPRKNIPRLVEAFGQTHQKEVSLVIVGHSGWNNKEKIMINRSIDKSYFLKNIHYLGFIDDMELSSLYKSCLFFIYPSLWEGFGYPVVEAMKFGVPVTSSNTSSLKEITQGAALLFNPLDSNDMYQCIDTLIHDRKLRDELSRKGLERSKMFTWKIYYNKFINVLETR